MPRLPARRTLAALLVGGALWLPPRPAVAQAAAASPNLQSGWLAKTLAAAEAVTEPSASPAPASPDYGEYAHALGYSFTKGLFSRDQVAPLAIGASIALAFVPADRVVSDRLRTDATVFNRAGEIAGSPITLGALSGGLLLGGLKTDDGRFRSYAFAFSQGLIVAESLAGAVKLVLRRERPDGSSRYGFPSGHAAGSFALAAVSAHYYGAKAGVPLYAVAGLVALSRVTYGKHFPSDVIAGATIGCLAAGAGIAATNHVTPKQTVLLGAAPGRFSITLRF